MLYYPMPSTTTQYNNTQWQATQSFAMQQNAMPLFVTEYNWTQCIWNHINDQLMKWNVLVKVQGIKTPSWMKSKPSYFTLLCRVFWWLLGIGILLCVPFNLNNRDTLKRLTMCAIRDSYAIWNVKKYVMLQCASTMCLAQSTRTHTHTQSVT